MKNTAIACLAGLSALVLLLPVEAKMPLPDPTQPSIRVEMRGTLSALWSHVGPTSFHLDVQGTTYHLQLGNARLRDQAEQLENRQVVVTGELRGQVVLVDGLRPESAGGFPLLTPIKIKGRIAENLDQGHPWGPARIVWEITANGRSFELDFGDNPMLLEMARTFRGRTLVVTGQLVNEWLELVPLQKRAAFRPDPPKVKVTAMTVEAGQDEYVLER
jgi:hypothetical protein